MKQEKTKSKSRRSLSAMISRLVVKGRKLYLYYTEGVWSDTRGGWKVDVIRTINLSVKSFLNTDLQARASALTYQTMLAIVPALALLLAIGRGFGLQEVLTQELYKAFPSQKEALATAFQFVDSYLSQSSEGLFVGVGIVFLLYTLISLLGSVEDSFNLIWGVKQGRSIGRKLTDYTAILLILPILMICSSGLSLFMSTALHKLLPFGFLTPAISLAIDFASLVITWLFFAGAYMLIPNTKVKFANALLAGALAGTGFIILQWIFVTGQMYVSRYNAIYGSFSLIPLLLIWSQLAWVITLAGAVLCYSSQNIFHFSFDNQIAHISMDYRRKITLAILTVIARRFAQKKPPLTNHDFAVSYNIPSRMAADVTSQLVECGLLSVVLTGDNGEEHGFQPAVPTESLTLGYALDKIARKGIDNFIPDFNTRFSQLINVVDGIDRTTYEQADKIRLADLEIKEILKP